jgi:hypothetical protein
MWEYLRRSGTGDDSSGLLGDAQAGAYFSFRVACSHACSNSGREISRAVLGLVKLAETRRPWRADDQEIDDVLGRFSL